MIYLHHINSLESVNDVVYNSVKIFFTGILFVYRECVSVKAFYREKNISKNISLNSCSTGVNLSHTGLNTGFSFLPWPCFFRC